MVSEAAYLKDSVNVCMSCPLPDCDYKHPRCLLHKASNEAVRLRGKDLPVPDKTHRAAMEWWRNRKIDEKARASEART